MVRNRKGEATENEQSAGQNSPQDHLTGVAEHTLSFFSETSAEALKQLGERVPGADVFAIVNTLTDDRAIRNLGGINQARTQELRILSTEPAIARIVVEEDPGDHANAPQPGTEIRILSPVYRAKPRRGAPVAG